MPCSFPPFSSALSKAKGDGFASAPAWADDISPVRLEEQFEGEAFADNLMLVDDCLAAFEALCDDDDDDTRTEPDHRGAAVSVAYPMCASRRSSRASTTKASHMMDKGMQLKASKVLQGISSHPITRSLSSFKVLALDSNNHLLRVAVDSHVILGSNATTPLELIDSFRANEAAQAVIAEGKARRDLARTIAIENRATVADAYARECAEPSAREGGKGFWAG